MTSPIHPEPAHVRTPPRPGGRTVAPHAIAPLDPDDAPALDALAELLLDCVAGGASVSFMQATLTPAKARGFWAGVADGVRAGQRVCLIARAPDGRIDGTVQLVLDLPDNQPHRADVAKLLVHRRARRQGLAARLMQALDEQALRHQRSVLVLDTVTGGDAERLYPRLGWQRVGEIPDYALWPQGGLCGTTVFHKRVGAHPAVTAPGIDGALRPS